LPSLLDVYGLLCSTLASIGLGENAADLEQKLIICGDAGLPAVPQNHCTAPADVTLTRHPAVSTGRIGRAGSEAPWWRRSAIA
jgi:hypothetical protein